MKEKLTLTPVLYIARGYKGQDVFHEYQGSGNVFISGNVATIYGVNGDLSRQHYKQMFKELRHIGVTTVRWERHKDNEVEFTEKDITHIAKEGKHV